MKKVLFIIIVMAMSIMTYAQMEVLNENFDGGALPAGWSTDATDAAYANDVGSCGAATFSFDCDATSPYWSYGSAGFSGFQATMDDDNANPNGSLYIISPVMDLSGGGDLFSFDWEHEAFAGGGNLIVEVFNGASWDQVFFADDDSNGHEDIDISNYFNADFQVRFVYDDEGGWQWGAKIDNVVISAFQAGPPTVNCKLDCPGDKVVYLDPGDCCWSAQYNARTEGDCTNHFDTILTAPPVTNGFTGDFDVSAFPEWNPDLGNFAADFAANSAAGGFTLNGPGSVNTAVQYGISGVYSAIDMTNLPNEITLYGRDRFTAGCTVEGAGALWNYTMVNFVAPYDGIFTFDWEYHNHDLAPFWDPFGYMWNGVWSGTYIMDPVGALDQTGTFTRHMNAGQSITFYVQSDDYPCSTDVIMSNMSFEGDAITDGIVLADGPAIGDPICDGETQTVKLQLLEHGKVIDSCQFDLTVHQYQNPTTTLACNDEVQISVDENCVGMVLPDMILEGGPYGCYDNYTVQIFSSMPVNVAGAVGDISNPAPLGTWVVGVYDETGNNCWSTITVLDKIPPTIECACPVGGDFPAGSVAPGSIAGTFSEIDKTAALHSECWDFGTGDQVPDHG
ncbi:MAG TPA: hypothetical protein ENI82_02485, partial [Bacteroidetes bacterium]|nr:hypothetical protein [Bacteroidota bacterium]